MSTLLDEIIEAYGGLKRWRDAAAIEAEGVYGGATWEFKGVADFAGTDHIVADVQRQRITLTQASGLVIEFDKDADVVIVMSPDGAVERLERPRASFDGYTYESSWSVAQAGYFRAYATWLSLVGPYVFTHAGVEVAETTLPNEHGEGRRGLRVTFPESIDAHNTTQLYYIDADGRLARFDYEAQINGGAPIAHYVPEHVAADGLVVARRHEVFARNADGTPDRSWMPISLELSAITVH